MQHLPSKPSLTSQLPFQTSTRTIPPAKGRTRMPEMNEMNIHHANRPSKSTINAMSCHRTKDNHLFIMSFINPPPDLSLHLCQFVPRRLEPRLRTLVEGLLANVGVHHPRGARIIMQWQLSGRRARAVRRICRSGVNRRVGRRRRVRNGLRLGLGGSIVTIPVAIRDWIRGRSLCDRGGGTGRLRRRLGNIARLRGRRDCN